MILSLCKFRAGDLLAGYKGVKYKSWESYYAGRSIVIVVDEGSGTQAGCK